MSRIFPAPCFLLLLPYAFSPTLSCVQAPTHTHSCISCPHPTLYAIDMLFLSFVWWKSRVFHAPAQSSSHQTCIFWSHLVYDVFSLHPFLPFLLSWTHPVVLFPMYVCVGGVCCPRAVQALPAGKWGERERSGGSSLMVFSCQPQKPSKYPVLELGVRLDKTMPESFRESRLMQNEVLLLEQPQEYTGTEA